MSAVKSIVMMGATGAVGSHTLQTLIASPEAKRLTLLVRRPVEGLDFDRVHQHIVDVQNPFSYRDFLEGHDVAICTLGVGEPSRISKQEFTKIDKDGPLDFATACKAAGVGHFQLLSSIGVSPNSSNFYMRSKGELENGLRQLSFERLSLFHPSMILTPKNRYGLSQALTLAIWPRLEPLLVSRLRKFRGIPVEQLGSAIAQNCFLPGHGLEILEWNDFAAINQAIGAGQPAHQC